MDGVNLLVSILTILIINECQVLGCPVVEDETFLNRNLHKKHPHKQVGLRNALGLKLAIFNLLFPKLGLSDHKHALKRGCESKNNELKLDKVVFQSSSNDEKDDMKGRLTVIKDLPDFGPLKHNRKDKTKDISGLSKELILKQALLYRILNLASDQKDTLERDYKSKNAECKLKRQMFQSSSKQRNYMMGKLKLLNLVKDLSDFDPLIHNRKDKSKDISVISTELKFKQAVLFLMQYLGSNQKVKEKREIQNKNHGLKLEREMFKSSFEEKNDDFLGKHKQMKEIAEDNKDLELSHNEGATGPVIVISSKSHYDFPEIGWKEVFGRKSQSDHKKGCSDRKPKDIKASENVKKLDAPLSSIEKNRECKGDDYKRIACNICQCDGGRWRCTSLACDIDKFSDYHHLNSLEGLSKEIYNKLRKKATGCVPGEKIDTDIKDCPCVCVLPSLMECEVCPAVEQILLPKKTTTTHQPIKQKNEIDLLDFY